MNQMILINHCTDISADISPLYRRYMLIYQSVCFFFKFFHKPTLFVSDISVIYRYIGDISSILSDFFRFFQETTFICKNRVRMARHPKYR